jgi:hypothetical protein
MHNPKGLLRVPPGATIVDVPEPTSIAHPNLIHTVVNGPLFPTAPSFACIRQGTLGDCYLLSALLGILNLEHGPELIEGMMCEEETGSEPPRVIVRLYYPGTGDQPPVARYFRICKTVADAFYTNSVQNVQRPLWALILEKAYATALVRFKPRSPNEPIPPGYDLLGGGGSSAAAWKILLGGAAQAEGFLSLDPLVHDLLNTAAEMFQAPGYQEKKLALQNAVFGHAQQPWWPIDLMNLWLRWFTFKGGWGKWDQFRRKGKINQVRKEDFLAFLKAHAQDKVDGQPLHYKVKEAVLSWLDSAKALPGKRGTGVYSRQQLELIADIQKALKDGKPVAACTNKTVGAGHGLHEEHAYAILKVDMKDHLYMLRLRNPHGATAPGAGRTYVSKQKDGRRVLAARAQAEPEFWLELSDLTKRFAMVYYGPDAQHRLAQPPSAARA